jgi:hypothetical protein
MNRAGMRRILVRVTTPLVTLALAGVASVVTAQPAQAARCATAAHVYVITPSVYTKWETDPINGPTYDFYVDVNGYGTATFELGGNGITPDEDPFWDLYDAYTNAYEGHFINTRANDNCVSNQRRYYVGRYEGDAVLFKASYYGGNSGATISQQAHFRIFFV